MSIIQFACPRCQHAHDDPFEVFDSDRLHSLRCEHCRQDFSFAIMECHRCAHEEVFTWPQAPSEVALSLLTCESCGSTFRFNDDSDEPARATEN